MQPNMQFFGPPPNPQAPQGMNMPQGPPLPNLRNQPPAPPQPVSSIVDLYELAVVKMKKIQHLIEKEKN